MRELLTNDGLFDKPETSQLAYAEAWLLVHYLLKQPQLPKFQTYLSGLPKLGNEKDRVKHAEKHLGPLRALEQEVRIHLRQVLKK
jgi:hypothetical protein